MGLRIGQGQRAGVAGDIADQAFADAQPGAVDGLGLQPFGCEEFQHLARPHDIGRADFRHHVGGDGAHDLLQALFGAAALGHQTAQAP